MDPVLKTTELGCTYRPSSLVVRFNTERPRIPHCLDALTHAPKYRQDVLDLVVESAFEPRSDDSSGAEVSEAWSISDLRSLLTLVASTVRSVTVLRESCDPTHPSLDGSRIFKGLTFKSLTYLAIHGSPTTTDHFFIPFSPSLAPQLRHLQLPSNMLSAKLSYDVPTIFPLLTRLTVHPLRPFCTVDQFDALMKIGEFLGVSARRDFLGPPVVGSSVQHAVDVTAYTHPASKRRQAELVRFKEAVEERLVGGTKGDFTIHLQDLEPSMGEVTKAIEEQLAASG